MQIVLNREGCPRCHHKMMDTGIVTSDFPFAANHGRCNPSFLKTEGRLECPACGVVIMVLVPEASPAKFHNMPDYLNQR